jgi:hypothetical protein
MRETHIILRWSLNFLEFLRGCLAKYANIDNLKLKGKNV